MEAMPKKTKKKRVAARAAVQHQVPHLKLYRRIAVTFVVVTFLTLAVVVYLSLARATVRVVTAPKEVSATFMANVVPTKVAEFDLAGKVVSNVFEQAESEPIASDSTQQVEAKAAGVVTITNTSKKDQPLVATTRLLTPDNILFRIDKSVTVPAGGSVQVSAHADQKGAAGDIPAGVTMTIPGLPASLQTLITAKNDQPFTGGLAAVAVVTQDALDAAGTKLEQEMLDGAKATLRLAAGGTYSGEAFEEEVLQKKSDTAPGTQASAVVVSMKIRVIGVFFNHDDLVNLSRGKLYEQIPQGMELSSIDTDHLTYTVTSADTTSQAANVNVTVSGTERLSATSSLLDKQQMLGKSASEIISQLQSSDAVKSAEISFTPFWLKRMPTLADHISVIIQ